MDDVFAPGRPRVRRIQPSFTQVVLFAATLVTTVWAGFWLSPLAAQGPSLGRVLEGGLPFAVALVAILFSHEMGHWVIARRHGVDTTLPYFIPVPFGAGTLGAVIRIRSPIPSRRAALEIGAAGPWAGFLVAVPALLWGLAHSEVQVVEGLAAASAHSPLDLARAWWAGQDPFAAMGAGPQVFGDSLVTWGAQRLLYGPLPEGASVVVHPVAFAAWLGLLLTTLNLVPFGQLDGGHVLYGLLGRDRARRAGEVVSAGLLLAGLVLSWNWLFWWLVTRVFIGARHPPALREEPLGAGGRAFALATFVLFAITFVPVPFSM